MTELQSRVKYTINSFLCYCCTCNFKSLSYNIMSGLFLYVDGQPIGRARCVGDGLSPSYWDPVDNCGRNLTADERLIVLEDVSSLQHLYILL